MKKTTMKKTTMKYHQLTSICRAIIGETFMQLHMRYTVRTMAYAEPEPTYSKNNMKNLWFLFPTQLFIHGQW
jgi:hypothetical protein